MWAILSFLRDIKEINRKGIQALNVRDVGRGEFLEGLSSLPYYERLTHFIRGSVKHWVTGGVTVVDIRPLYAVTIHHFHRHIAEHIKSIEEKEVTSSQLKAIKDILHEYSKSPLSFSLQADQSHQLMHCGISSLYTPTDGTLIL
jgi:hypothetical protein